MMQAVVLRPEPGNTRTAAALRALGMDVHQVPVFAVVPVAWTAPDPAAFDALLLTSANAVRHGGDGLQALTRLPVVAVGATTAAAARNAGFTVAITGTKDAQSAIVEARDRGFARLLHIAGRARTSTDDAVETVTVYTSDPVPLDPAIARSFEDHCVLVHSARAAARLAALVEASGADRARIAVVALSPAVGDAAGPGWRRVRIAPQPTDPALAACAAAECGHARD